MVSNILMRVVATSCFSPHFILPSFTFCKCLLLQYTLQPSILPQSLHISFNLWKQQAIKIKWGPGPMHSEESLFPYKHRWSLLLFFWLKWAGYLAVSGSWHRVLHTTRTYPIRYLSQKIQACHSKVSCPFQPKNNNGNAQSLEKDSPHCATTKQPGVFV